MIKELLILFLCLDILFLWEIFCLHSLKNPINLIGKEVKK